MFDNQLPHRQEPAAADHPMPVRSLPGDQVEGGAELEHDLRTYLSTRGDLCGRIGPFAPIELVQFFQVSRKCGLLKLFSAAAGQAQCVVTEAGIASAVAGHLRGTEAAISLLGWRSGWFVFEQGSHLVPVDACTSVGSVLMEAARLEDELERRRYCLPERDAHLVVETDAAWGPDPVGCSLGLVFERIAARPGTSCAELEGAVELAPVKVRLAVAILIERGVAREEERHLQRLPNAETDPQRWWSEALVRFPNGLRVVIGLPPAECPEGISIALEHLARDLGAAAAPARYSPSSPTFVTLHGSEGGLLCLTLVPMGRRHRFLLESLATSAHLTIVCGGNGGEVEAWRIPVARNVRVRCMKGTCAQRGCDIYTHIRRWLSHAGCPELDGCE
jgi:hypothetical protein